MEKNISLFTPYYAYLMVNVQWFLSCSVSSVYFCVCVSKSLRKWTQTDTKVNFHPPTRPLENFFWSQMKGVAKIRLFYSGAVALILPCPFLDCPSMISPNCLSFICHSVFFPFYLNIIKQHEYVKYNLKLKETSQVSTQLIN